MLKQIEHKIPSLSRSGQRIAKWVIDHPKQAAESTLAGVARECATSEPTVIRFCRQLGLDGFRDFTIRMTEALSQPVGNIHRDVRADNTAADAVIKVMDSSIASLVEIRSRLSSMPVDEAVAAMALTRQICFVGMGASGHVAGDAWHKFFRLGIPCNSLTDLPTLLQFSAIAEQGDVFFVISSSGQWPEQIRAAELVRSRGGTIIALTNPQSDLAAVADILFASNDFEDTSVYTPMSSRLAQLALLDALQVSLALVLGESAVERLSNTKTALLQDTVRPLKEY